NTFEYLKLPGAVVHGNVQCEDVANANEWRYRGGLDEQEYNFDVNDADPNFAGARLFEGYEYTYGNPHNGLLTGAIQRLSGFSSTTFVNATLRRKNHYHFFEHSTPIDRMADPILAQLDEYPQHDDNGLAPIINEWVDGYLRLYYHSDQDVKGDTELQGFLYETTHYGNR
ncbi:lipoxygenase family protein, partial [Grimontia sedimenti]|uniref:lipoxygenase family protein n=1 Tax=Grimontia sedimenti TaxID=2711294 RepID=UPI0022A6D5E1